MPRFITAGTTTIITAALLILIGGSLPVKAKDNLKDTYQSRCQQLIDNAAGQSDIDRLNRMFELYWDNKMEEFPEWGTMNGYSDGNDRWTDHSLEANARRKQDDKFPLEVLATISRDNLSEADRMNYDLFKDKIELDTLDANFPSELMPVNQMGNVCNSVARNLRYTPHNTVDECKDVLSRMEAVPALVDQTITLLKKGLAEGYTPPRPVLDDLLPQVRNHITSDPKEAPALAWLKELPATMVAADRETIRTRAIDTYTNKMVPAYEQFYSYLSEEYLPNCRASIAMSDLPGGREWYVFRVRQYTTTTMTPDEIFELGQTEVKRIRGLMDELIKSTEFDGNFADFCEFLRTDSQFYWDTPEQLLTEYRDISKRADAQLPKLFRNLPSLPYGVIEIPAYDAKSQTTAYYQPGSIEAGRAGYFYANTYDLKSRPRWEMEALTLHEAVPGHHLQIALAQELTDLPKFRRHGWVTAYGEGWGLYSESLGEEMGFYADPYSKFGQLTYEMWRAIRLVVDVGMHYKGWSRQKAIDFFKENASKTEHDIVVEIDRYIVWPGQALAYKIGELKIKELRRMAEVKLGERFDIRSFHDEVLKHGGIPLNILEANINRWVRRQE